MKSLIRNLNTVVIGWPYNLDIFNKNLNNQIKKKKFLFNLNASNIINNFSLENIKKLTNKEKEDGAAAWARKDLDAAQTRTQEKEQQLEQEKQKQREIEREASPWKATTRDNDTPIIWNLQDLLVR